MNKPLVAVLGSLLIGMLAAPLPALAGEPPTDELNKKLEALMDRVKDLEAKKAAPEAEKKDLWTDRVKLFGDLRLRFENIEQPGRDPEVNDRERFRARVRLGLEAKVNDDVDVKFRIATSEAKDVSKGADPTSTNQTLTGGESKKGIWLDIAQFDYHPAAVPGLGVIGGKMEVPFYRPGKSDLIWDGDLAPEGGAVKYCPKFGDFELMSTVAGFSTMEREADRDAALFGTQGGLKLNLLDKKAYVLAGVGYYDYTHTEGFAVFDYSGSDKSYGNTKNGLNEYRFDYNEVEFFAEAGYTLEVMDRKIPLSVFGDVVQNNASGVKEDDRGWMIGGSIGKLNKLGDLAFGYNYRELEKDAVLGAFTDSDSWGGGTNGKGHKLSLEAQVMKNVSVGATYFLDKANISDTDTSNKEADYRRFQLDISFKF